MTDWWVLKIIFTLMPSFWSHSSKARGSFKWLIIIIIKKTTKNHPANLISVTSCLLASNFFFQSLTSTSLVMIWKKKNQKIDELNLAPRLVKVSALSATNTLTVCIALDYSDKCVPLLWWGWEPPAFQPHWCRWNPGPDFPFLQFHFPRTCSSVCRAPRTAEDTRRSMTSNSGAHKHPSRSQSPFFHFAQSFLISVCLWEKEGEHKDTPVSAWCIKGLIKLFIYMELIFI